MKLVGCRRFNARPAVVRLEAFNEHDIRTIDVREEIARIVVCDARTFRNRLAVAGENHRIRAGIAKARGVAFIAIVQRVMCVFDRGHAHAARDEARDQLDDERRLSSSRPAGDRNRVHLLSLC